MSDSERPSGQPRPVVVWTPLVLGIVGLVLTGVLAAYGRSGPVLVAGIFNGLAVSGFLFLIGLIALRAARIRIPLWVPWLWLAGFGAASGVVAFANHDAIWEWARASNPVNSARSALALLIFGPLVGLLGLAVGIAVLVGRRRAK